MIRYHYLIISNTKHLMRQLRSYMTKVQKKLRAPTHLHKCDMHLSCKKKKRFLFLFPYGYLVIMPQVV